MTTTKERAMTLAELRTKLAELPPEWEHAPVVAVGQEEHDVTGATGIAVYGKDGPEYAVLLRICPTHGRRFTPAPPDVDAIKAGALALIEVVVELATVEAELSPEDSRAYGERVYNHAVAILRAVGVPGKASRGIYREFRDAVMRARAEAEARSIVSALAEGPHPETRLYRLEEVEAATALPPGRYVVERGGEGLILVLHAPVALHTLGRFLEGLGPAG